MAQPIIAPRNVAGEGWPPAPVDHYPRQVTNADPAPVHVTVHELMASADQERGPDAYRKGLGLFAAIAGGLAAVIAVAALVFVLASRSGGAAAETDVPTLGGPPPTDVQLRDSGSGIEVRWQDPSEGTVSFMVTMGHPGEELKPITTLGPGQTSYELGGLNPSLNYCFAVIAVYRSDQFATSPQSCTSRASATPR
ncbi:MAG: fibronectin type III domain-containing protein [Actinoplanes sp.]